MDVTLVEDPVHSPVKTSTVVASPASSSALDDPTGPGTTTETPKQAPTMSTATATTPTMPTGLGTAIQEMNRSTATTKDTVAPPKVNAVVAAAMIPSSAMTPTTTNYSMSEQLVKSTGTLTPLGEDKINTAGPASTQKARQTKKKAAAAKGEAAPKKPTPRIRAKADPNKAEKRKASPARNNASTNGNSTPTNGTTGGPIASTVPSGAVPTSTTVGVPSQTNTPIAANTPTGQRQELLPSQDTELRREYLQRIYRQLQMTHRNQDDATVRRLATNIEIEICRRATTRNEYVTYMNQQIHSLMQAELTNGTVGLQSSLYVPGVPAASSSNGMHAPVTSGGMPQPGLQHASAAAYKQSSTPGSTGLRRTSSASQGSFMSLLSSQAPMQGFEAARSQQQYGSQGLPPHTQQATYATMNSAPGYSHGQGTPQNAGIKTAMQGDIPSQQAYAGQGQRMPSQANSTSAPPEFAAQFQRLDRSGLLDLLWTQHKTVIQYQRRLAQLEVQLNLRQQPGSVGPANNMMPTTANAPSGYYNASPRQPGVPAVPANLSAEAEAQRARDRANSRAVQHPGQYQQHQYPGQAPPTPSGGVNPQLYWEKVRQLREAYLRHLYVAHQALSQHSAPENSAQGAKAENVKHNISLACQILSETPTAIQPRPLEVLESIERFIQTTVVPIVRKVSPQVLTPTTSGVHATSTPLLPSQQTANGMDLSRNAMAMPSVSQTMPMSTSSTGLGFSTAPSPPVAPVAPAPSAKGATKAGTTKSSAKAGGKKSPSNGTKKTATPKATAPKSSAKGGGKKSPGKATGAKQTTTQKQTIAISTENADSAVVPQASQAATAQESLPVAVDAPKDRSEVLVTKSGAMTDDDSLNDFADFADLDFDDDLPSLSKVSSNKENAAGENSRKRSIEDV